MQKRIAQWSVGELYQTLGGAVQLQDQKDRAADRHGAQ